MLKLAVNFASLCLKALYGLCRLFPMRNRLVCISRQSDTPPLDFQLIADYCRNRTPPLDVVILAKQLRNPLSYLPEIVRQVFYIATSKAVVLDSYCIVVSLLGSTIKTPVIQIWHALGNMKKFGYTALDEASGEGRSPKLARLMHMHEGYDAIAISSLDFREDFAAGFNADPAIIFEAPLPRVDLLLDSHRRARARELFREAHPQLQDKQVIAYCPTFRRTRDSGTSHAMESLMGAVDFNRYALVYKPHPVSTLAIDDPRVITASASDPDPLLIADYVISDYSTIIYEAGLLGVPVFLYAYDWETYREKRGLNIDIAREVPTLFTNDAAAILAAIERDEFDYDAYQQFTARNIALPTHGTCTEYLCERIIAFAEGEECP